MPWAAFSGYLVFVQSGTFEYKKNKRPFPSRDTVPLGRDVAVLHLSRRGGRRNPVPGPVFFAYARAVCIFRISGHIKTSARHRTALRPIHRAPPPAGFPNLPQDLDAPCRDRQPGALLAVLALPGVHGEGGLRRTPRRPLASPASARVFSSKRASHCCQSVPKRSTPGCKTLEQGSATCPPEDSATHKSGRQLTRQIVLHFLSLGACSTGITPTGRPDYRSPCRCRGQASTSISR